MLLIARLFARLVLLYIYLFLNNGTRGVGAAANGTDDLGWGTYRPHLYFGLRTTSPKSPITGLVWFGIQDYPNLSKQRHLCEQDDGVGSYHFERHDGRSAAVQVIDDIENNIRLTISFLKVPGGTNGGNWATRVQGQPIDGSRLSRISLVHYFALQDGGSLEIDTESEDEDGLERNVNISGFTEELGEFELRFVEGRGTTPLSRGRHADDFGDKIDRFRYLALQLPEGNAWRAKDHLFNEASKRAQDLFKQYGQDSMPDPAVLMMLPNEARFGANIVAVQRSFEGAFQMDIFFDSKSAKATPLDEHALSAGLEAFITSYDARFERAFGLERKGFPKEQIGFARTATADLVGGIGYFYGASIIEYAAQGDNDLNAQQASDLRLSGSVELLTATSSRPAFARGLYGNEGYHLSVLSAWDSDLSLEILKSWLNLIDDNGWVAREQILGEELRSRVYKDFWVQNPHHANPPTLMLAVSAFVARLKTKHGNLNDLDLSLDARMEALADIGDASSLSTETLADQYLSNPALAADLLRSIYPQLRRHYLWFKNSQKGQITEWGRKASSRSEGYRWRGRGERHILTAGLDDYPRIKPHVGELHVDLLCWMGMFSRSMSELAEYLQLEEDMEEYDYAYEGIVANLEDLHWNAQEKMYCDVSVDSDEESLFVCQRGYVSLFPLLLQILDPASDHLGNVLDIMEDPDHLWTPYGLVSLSKSEPFFETPEKQWRRPIWLNINYLALQALYNKYAKTGGPHQQRCQQMYEKLRHNLITNVEEQFRQTGFIWEEYDPNNGSGQRNRPFTGFSALIVNIMAEIY